MCGAVEAADHQRPDAERIAGADQLLVGERDQRIGAFERAQRIDEAVDEAVAARLRDQMQDDLGIGGRLHHGAVADQLAAQREAVGQVAVVADREAAGIELGEQRLHVAQDGLAGGRVAHMADRRHAGQPLDHLAPREGVADQAEPALGMETAAVERDDAGRFLAAMLQGVQAERRDGGRVRMPENAEHAAFLAQPVAVQIEVERGRRLVQVVWRVDHLAHRLSGSISTRPLHLSRARRSRHRGCRVGRAERRPARRPRAAAS